jgi:hypothetical protein
MDDNRNWYNEKLPMIRFGNIKHISFITFLDQMAFILTQQCNFATTQKRK